ncbi:MAG: hypothetical protein ACYTKC_13095 [Planctomycetota bacterium]|jgi:hypothetical protein
MAPRAQRQARPAKKAQKKALRKKQAGRKPAKTIAKKAAKKAAKKVTREAAKKTSGKPTKKNPKSESGLAIQRPAKWKSTDHVAHTSTRGGSKARSRPVSKPPKLDMNADVMEFIAAIDAYKREYHRPFPGWSEILFVLKRMGYKKRPGS